MPTKNNVRLGGAYVEITANNGKLIDALKDSESRIQTFVNEFAKTGASLSALGLGVAAPMKKAVDTFAEFEKQMLITQAVTKATDAQLARLTKQAKDLGATTSWTAAQVAEGMVALGRMGFSNREIQGTISSVMDLGRALDTDVNQAAKELGAVMRQFQADSSQAGHYADALATATNGAAIEMDELLESMKYVGTAGNALGADVETVLALTMALRNAGVSASQAGTQLRSMFISLQAPKNLQLFADKFGVEIYDANGRLKSFIDILIEAQKRAGALGDQLLLVARQMFGKLQAPGFLALLQSPDLERFRDMLYDCDGAAEAFREGMESGVYGSLKRSLSMVERVSIDLGESLAPTVREVEDAVKDITTFIGRFIEENKPLINLIAKTALEFGSLGATMLAGAGIMKGFAGTSRLVFTGATNIALAWRKAGETAETLNVETTALETTLAKMAGTAPGEALAASLNTAAVAAKEATAAVEGLASANAKLGATFSVGMAPSFRHTNTGGMTFNPGAGAGSINIKAQKIDGVHFASTNKSAGVSGTVNVGQTFSASPSALVVRGRNPNLFTQRSILSMSDSEQTDALAVAMRNRARYAKRYAQLEAAINQRIGGDQLAMSQKEAAVLNNLRRRVYYYDNVVSQISQMRLRFTQAAPDDVGQYDYATSSSATGAPQFKVNSQTASLTKKITQATEANNKYSVSTKAVAGNLSLVSGESAKAAPKIAAVADNAKKSSVAMQALRFAANGALGVLKTIGGMAVAMLAWTAVEKVFQKIAEYAHKTAEEMARAKELNVNTVDKVSEKNDELQGKIADADTMIDDFIALAGSDKVLNNVEARRLDLRYKKLVEAGYLTEQDVVQDPTRNSGYRILNAGAASAMKARARGVLLGNYERSLGAARIDLSSIDPGRFKAGSEVSFEEASKVAQQYKFIADALNGMTAGQRREILGGFGVESLDVALRNIEAKARQEATQGGGMGGAYGFNNEVYDRALNRMVQELLKERLGAALKYGDISAEDQRAVRSLFAANNRGLAGAVSQFGGADWLEQMGKISQTITPQKILNYVKEEMAAFAADAKDNRSQPFQSEKDAKQAEADAATAAADLATKFAEFDAALGKAEERAKSPAQRELDALEKQFKEIQEGMKGSTDQAKLDELAKLEERYTAQRVELQKQINEELEREAQQRAKENSERVVEGLNADVRDFIGAIFAGNGQKADDLGAGIDAQLRNFAGTDVDLSKFYEESVSTIRDALERTKTTLSSTGTFNAYEAADFGRDYQLDVQKEQLAMLRSANRGLQNIYAFMQSDDQYKEYM